MANIVFSMYVVRVVDMSSNSHSLMAVCLQETGGIGVNCIIDSGGTVYFTSSLLIFPRAGLAHM